MQTAMQIDFQEMDPSEAVSAMIEQKVAELESRFGRITKCRVTIKGPGDRHKTGGLHQIKIHLSLPQGRTVNVDRIDHSDERYSDLNFAIGDAFKRARRQLEGEADHLHEK